MLAQSARVGAREGPQAGAPGKAQTGALAAAHGSVDGSPGEALKVLRCAGQHDRLHAGGIAHLVVRPGHGERQPDFERVRDPDATHLGSTSRTAAITSPTSASLSAGESGRLTVCRPMRNASAKSPGRQPYRSR